MGIFSGLFRSRDKPKNATAGSAYRFYFRQQHERQACERARGDADDGGVRVC